MTDGHIDTLGRTLFLDGIKEGESFNDSPKAGRSTMSMHAENGSHHVPVRWLTNRYSVAP